MAAPTQDGRAGSEEVSLEDLARSLGEVMQLRELVVRRNGLENPTYRPKIAALADGIGTRWSAANPDISATTGRLKALLDVNATTPGSRELVSAQFREEIGDLETALLAAANQADPEH